MPMSLAWCKKQGMKLIEPNDNLAEEYFRNAEETLRVTNLISHSGSNMWLATQKYYAEYLAAYSLLMRIGVKSDIHSCTIEVIALLERQGLIPFRLSEILENDKELRIDNQYYLKNRPVDFDAKALSGLLLEVRKVLDRLTPARIQKVRDSLG